MDKYFELITTNWVEVELLANWGDHKEYKWSIIWVNVLFITEWEKKTEYSYSWPSKETETYTWSIWLITNVWSYWERLFNRIKFLFEKQQKEIERIEKIKQKDREEVAQRKKDSEFMEEYKRLCWSSKEFSKHFKIIEKIEELWKRQANLMTEWQENHDEIFRLRKEFYSIAP